MHRIVLYFFLAGLLSLSGCTDEKSSKLRVLSSIKPIQAIVVAIAGKHIVSQQLIPDFSSPHHYSFKPSDIRKIKNSDIIFRIDEHFETIINPALKNASHQAKIISLAENPSIDLLPLSGKHSHDDAEENHNEMDMHIFTSPKNAIEMAKVITKILSEADPENTKNYQANYLLFTKGVIQKSNTIQSQLSAFKNKPYIVFHDSWQYFAAYFSLQQPKIIHYQEGATSGAKTLMATRNDITSMNIHCVFSDPSISSKNIHALTKGLAIHNTKIDVLAETLAMNKNTYINWLEDMGSRVKNCLAR